MLLPVKLPPGRVWLATALALALMSLAPHARLAETSSDEAGEAPGPPLMDWQTYTTAFNKSYSSWRQALVRQNLFTVKQLQVFITAVKYRLNPLGYYLVINEYSDMTPEEERRRMSGDHADDDDDDDELSGDDVDGLMDDEAVRQLLMAELEEASRGGGGAYDTRKPDAARLAAAIKRQQELKRQKLRKHPHKRSIDEQTTTTTTTGKDTEPAPQDLSLKDLVRIPDPSHSSNDEFENAQKIKWVVPSNNPDYQPMEQMTMGIGFNTPDHTAEKVNDVPEEDIEKIEQSASSWIASVSSYLPNLGVVNFLSGSAKGTFTWLRSKSFKWRQSPPPQQQQQQQQEPLEQAEARRFTRPRGGEGQQVAPPSAKGDTRVVRDWRETGCISPPIYQGDCMSCYAVAAVSHLEWSFCMHQDRVLTPLSIQYLLSCGPQMRLEQGPKMNLQLYGCDRGRSLQAMHFMKEYGAELAAHMPYLARDTPCPIEPGTPRRNKGYLRPNVKQPVRMYASTTQLDLALKVGPVIVNFHQPHDFFAYGGGMVGRCHPHGSHAMLIVGHGVENDKPYLIIKNSFGTNWGMRGYFKFDREYTTECVKDFVLPRFSFPSKKSQARHMKAYLAERQESKMGGDEVPSSPQENSVPNLDKIFNTEASGLL